MERRRLRPVTKLSKRKKLFFSAVTVTLFFSLLEIGCRVCGLGAPREVADYIADWGLQWNSDFYTIDTRFAGTNSGINSDGLRDREHPVEKAPNVMRIVCLGDSVTFGYMLPAQFSYPSILESDLRRGQHPSSKTSVEVFNVALPGWSTRQERIAWERIASKYQPDVVILGVCLNDIPELRNNLTERPSPIVAFLYRNSWLIRWVMSPHAREIYRVEELFEHANEPRIQQAWQLFFDEVLELSRDVQQSNAELIVLLFPFRLQTQLDAPDAIPQQLVREFCESNSIVFVDGMDALKPLGGSGFIDYDHLAPQGAAAISRLLIESKYLPFDRERFQVDVSDDRQNTNSAND